MVRDILIRLEKSGELCELMQAGYMSPKAFGHLEMFMRYDVNVRVKGMKSTEAKCEVCNIFNCDIRTVERAIEKMNQ